MNRHVKKLWVTFLFVIAITVTAHYATGGMTVFLKDGRVVQVPVNKEDILGISFEGSSVSMGDKPAKTNLPVKEGLVMWLDASDIGGLFRKADGTDPVSVGNDPVGLWQDKSGNDNHFTQTRQEARPRFMKTGIGGKPSIIFEPSQSMLLATNFPAPVTVVYAAKQTGGANNRVLSAVANNWLLGYWNGAKNQAFFEGWVSSAGSPVTDNLSHVFTGIGRGRGQNSEVWADGATVATNQNGVAGPNGLAINAGAYPGEASNCQIAELIVYNRDLSRDEKQDIETYLKSKWGINR